METSLLVSVQFWHFWLAVQLWLNCETSNMARASFFYWLTLTVLVLISSVKFSDPVKIVCYNEDTTWVLFIQCLSLWDEIREIVFRTLCEVRRLIVLYDHEPADRPEGWGRHETTLPAIKAKLANPDNQSITIGPTTTEEPFRFLPKTFLLVSHCNTTYLPHRLSRPFPHLTSLFVWYSGLRVLFEDSLYDLPNIININFENNEIAVLDPTTFSLNTRVTYLNLGFNKIRVLHGSLLLNLVRLETFIANSNQIESLPQSLFLGNTKLKFINLNNNRIKVIEVDFKKLNSLKKVLGLSNDCANFFLTKNFSVNKLDLLLKSNCSHVRTTPVPDDWTVEWNLNYR